MKKIFWIILLIFLVIISSAESRETQKEKDCLIFAAIKNNNFDLIKKIISEITNIDILDKINQTPLCVAVAENKTEIVKLLIQKGANVNFASNRSAPIVYAADNNNIEIIKVLLANGADINSTARYSNMSGGSSAILEAIINNSFELVEFLLQSGADINKGTFIEGEGAAILLVEDCNIRIQDDKIVMRNNNLKMLNYILENGFDVEQESYGNALSVAVQRENIEAIKILLKHNADPEKYINNIGMTVRELAIKKGNKKVISLL